MIQGKQKIELHYDKRGEPLYIFPVKTPEKQDNWFRAQDYVIYVVMDNYSTGDMEGDTLTCKMLNYIKKNHQREYAELLLTFPNLLDTLVLGKIKY